ncbi:MAG: hypothetical protein AAFU53_16260 [Cyanobacteria bacterium J06632_3]
MWNLHQLLMLSSRLIKKDAFADLWSLIQGAIALDPQTFQSLQNQPNSLLAALTIVFIAGFAQSLSQIVVLFVNQVRPLRFVLSLWISALFFVIGYVFWAISSWAILNTVFDGYLPFNAVVRTLGFSYAPLMLGIFVVIPYFGSAIFVLLSIWTLLAVVVGIDSITTLGRWEAFGCVALGWVVLQLLQKTVGQPIASLGQWITNWAAGEELITNRNRLSEELYAGLKAQRAVPERISQASASRVSRDHADQVHARNVPLQPRK